MSPTLTAAPETFADLLDRLGHVPAWRIRLQPPPGTATERDVLEIHARTKRLYELIDGALVEKAMGFRESALAGLLIEVIRQYLRQHRLGTVAGESGMMRLVTGRVRIPDVSFVSWDKLPGRRLPEEPIPDLSPDLAVEVLSESNTAEEMAIKRREYFASGTRLVWQIDPATRTAEVFTGPDQSVTLDQSQSLDGGDVLPGFALSLRELFAELDRQPPAAP
jgi:Uma2 family endonuclease